MSKRFTKWLMLGLAAGLVVALVVSGCAPKGQATPTTPAQTQVIKWVGQDLHPAGSYENKETEKFAADVKAMSGGRLVIEFHPSAGLVPNTEIYDSVSKGTLDIGISSGSYWRAKNPIFDIEYGLPFGPRSMPDLAATFLDYGFLDLLQEAYNENNIFYVSPNIESGLALYGNKPIRTLDDFKGLKVRTIGLFAEQAKLLGAGVVFFPVGEMYMSVQTGVVDHASWGGLPAGYNIKLHEVSKYAFAPFFSYAHAGSDTVINLDKWKALPEDLKQIVLAAGWSRTWNHIQFQTIETERLKRILPQQGVEVTSLSPQDELKATELAMTIWNDLANKDPRTAKAIDIFKQVLRDRGQLK